MVSVGNGERSADSVGAVLLGDDRRHLACGGYDGEYYLHSMEANKTFGSSISAMHPVPLTPASVRSRPFVGRVLADERGRATLGVTNMGGSCTLWEDSAARGPY